MPESFSGPWSVSVQSTDSVFAQRFVIEGSDSSDGAYPATPGTSIGVTGGEWTISADWLDGNTFVHSAMLRTATYDVQDGLVVTLAADDSPPETADHDFNDMILILQCEDPALDPLRPNGIPYDFTVPEGTIVR
jgi:hypothetical protein